jgi:hypothetical protein
MYCPFGGTGDVKIQEIAHYKDIPYQRYVIHNTEASRSERAKAPNPSKISNARPYCNVAHSQGRDCHEKRVPLEYESYGQNWFLRRILLN